MSLSPELRGRITALVQSNSVFLFMKGNRHQPQCGFSASVVGMLGGLTSDYETFDVLSDPEVREGIKEFSNPDTHPKPRGMAGNSPPDCLSTWEASRRTARCRRSGFRTAAIGRRENRRL
jgi:glutaredoxin-related protein